ncbi:hypothetical protein [Phaeodactylibacter sp.]|uniref:hypothetical protein n=1 Tax=Phaeodactylibacter sp. TaxID=1940289 RepID=UPI0025E96811|nr:hypothetical protein [Phaeodactylibacter sp.]MCI4650839.1 hypothetical protein [Phaeodactylibacter sp.]MCI5089796.1 hypothetical protein [Phaeodactylibacter sp.]
MIGLPIGLNVKLMYNSFFTPRITVISGVFPVTWRQIWRMFRKKEVPVEIQIEQDATYSLTGVYVQLEHTQQTYKAGGEAIAFAEWITQEIEIHAANHYVRRFTRIESKGRVKWIDNAPEQRKSRTTSEMYELFKVEKQMDISIRVDRIVEMLCDCMSKTDAQGERPNIIQLIQQGKTDEQIYRLITWHGVKQRDL